MVLYGNGNRAHKIHVHMQNHLTLLVALSLNKMPEELWEIGSSNISKSREQ